MDLSEIYQPIKEELKNVDGILAASFQETRNKSILKLNRFLLEAPGKRLRPALMILSSKATSHKEQRLKSKELIKIASSIELIHMASLIHDDIIDRAERRHNRPTVNSKWGQDVSIALGDYLYSLAFKLISSCGNTDILGCISSATKNMCEGELVQVCERDNFSLLKERYILIVKKKTASLFAASSEAGAMLAGRDPVVESALKEYGLNFGIAFQIIDDCLDLIGEQKHLGKAPGADFKMGELTLPLLNLVAESKDKKRIISLLTRQNNFAAFKDLRLRFIHSQALAKTKADISHYLKKAKSRLGALSDSPFKQSLSSLADFISRRIP